MASEQKKLLEKLMGEHYAGGGMGPRAPQLAITDPKVCRSYVVGTCPHDLFTNTKQDFGPCPRVHSEQLKAEYDRAGEEQQRRWGFKFDQMRDMGRLVDECNKRIEVAQRRLEQTPEELRKTAALLAHIADLTTSIELGLAEVWVLASDAELRAVNLATVEYFRVRQQKAAREEKERELKALTDTSGPSGHQKLQVCDVCGAYLSRLDNDRRLADHFFGKMHLGYAQMRKTHETLVKELRGKAAPLPTATGVAGGAATPRSAEDAGADTPLSGARDRERDRGGRDDPYDRRRSYVGGGGGGGSGRRGNRRW